MADPRGALVEPRLVSRTRLLDTLIDFEMEPGAQFRLQMLLPGELPGMGWECLPRSAVESGSGLALITAHVPPLDPQPRLAIAPPFPITAASDSSSFEPLQKLISEQWTVAVILLRLGNYAVGVAENEKLVVSKTGARYVHGRHRAGGQSQRRWERNREHWIRELFDEACEIAKSRFSAYDGHIDWLALGGDRQVLSQFMKRCDALGDLSERVLPWRVPVDKPGRSTLEHAVTAVWSARVYEPPAP